MNRTSCYHLDNVTDKIQYDMLLKYMTEATAESELPRLPPLKKLIHYTGKTTCPIRKHQPEETNKN